MKIAVPYSLMTRVDRVGEKGSGESMSQTVSEQYKALHVLGQ